MNDFVRKVSGTVTSFRRHRNLLSADCVLDHREGRQETLVGGLHMKIYCNQHC